MLPKNFGSKYIISGAAALGFCIMLYTVYPKSHPPVLPSEIPPPRSTFDHQVGGLGVTESRTRDVSIGTNIAGIVTKIPITVGQKVKKGDLLFTIDERDAKARLEIAKVDLENAKTQFSLYEHIKDRRAVSINDYNTSKFAYEKAKANVNQIQTEIDRLNVKAPLDATILRINVKEGEYAPTGSLVTPLMVLGDIDRIYVRVEIDESDLARFDPKGKTIGFIRGDSLREIPLRYEYKESLLTPKRTLAGNGAETVDTRIQEVVYSFKPEDDRNYVGQQMDVFSEVKKDDKKS